jgi:TATA-box binding protein (TBP) (component of TFIID and TFIIIB)
MELNEFTAKSCMSKTACEFIPKKKKNLNLNEIAEKLRKKGVLVDIETPYVLILKFKGKNISFFKSGKIIIKETPEEKEGKKIAKELMEKLK